MSEESSSSVSSASSWRFPWWAGAAVAGVFAVGAAVSIAVRRAHLRKLGILPVFLEFFPTSPLSKDQVLKEVCKCEIFLLFFPLSLAPLFLFSSFFFFLSLQKGTLRNRRLRKSSSFSITLLRLKMEPLRWISLFVDFLQRSSLMFLRIQSSRLRWPLH